MVEIFQKSSYAAPEETKKQGASLQLKLQQTQETPLITQKMGKKRQKGTQVTPNEEEEPKKSTGNLRSSCCKRIHYAAISRGAGINSDSFFRAQRGNQEAQDRKQKFQDLDYRHLRIEREFHGDLRLGTKWCIQRNRLSRKNCSLNRISSRNFR